MTDPLTLCREKISHWQAQLESATARPPLDPVMRERVEATCAERIAAWNRRLRALERERAA